MTNESSPAGSFEIGPSPENWKTWAGELWAGRDVAIVLARKDFQTRYKRASLGLTWAVALPLLQSTVIAFVFSRVARFDVGDTPYAVFVLSGMVAWSYLASTLSTATTAIVDGSGLADKVWFPRAALVLAPVLANLASLVVAIVVLLVVLAPVLGAGISWHLLIMIPATALLAALVLGLSLVTSALHVYFRDVKFVVQAALLVWFYATPIIYPSSLLGRLEPWSELNPMSGVIALFHLSATGDGTWVRPVVVSAVAAVASVAAGLEAHRRYDRLFVDLL